MKTSNLVLTIIFLITTVFNVFSQNSKDDLSQQSSVWDVTKCINYALDNNIQVKQMDLQVKSSKSNLEKSKASLLPSVNANGSYSSNRGRSIDPTTNDYTNSEYSNVNLSVGASLTLFNGLRNYNSIKQNQYNLQASLAEFDEMKYNITMQVAIVYLQVLLDTELSETSKNQYNITKAQVDRTQTLVDAGSLAKASLLEIQAQLASEDLNKIRTENNLKTSYLNLKQLLELDTTEVFRVKNPILEDPLNQISIDNTEDIFEKSLDLPAIKKESFRLQSRERELQMAKGGISPTVTLAASYGSGYSSRIKNVYNFNDQLSNNLNLAISLSVRIPIFNGFSVRNNIAQSRIAVENSKYQLDAAKNNLFKDIQKARNAAESSLAKYKASKKAVEAQSESFEYTKQRFNLGLVNSVEYNTAKNNYIKAESDMIQSKYDFIFRINILKFYQGIPFKL